MIIKCFDIIEDGSILPSEVDTDDDRCRYESHTDDTVTCWGITYHRKFEDAKKQLIESMKERIK